MPQLKGKKLLAEKYGVNPETVAEWRDEGAPLDQAYRTTDRGLEDWLGIYKPALLAKYRGKPAPGPLPDAPDFLDGIDGEEGDETNWSIALKREQTLKLRRENAYKEGRLLDRNEVEICINRIATTMRDRLMSVPRAVAPECENKQATKIEAIITREIREAMSSMAEALPAIEKIAKGQA